MLRHQRCASHKERLATETIYIYDENDVDNPPVLYKFKLVRKPGGGAEWNPSKIHNASGVGTQIVVTETNNDGRIEIVTSARKGTFVFRVPTTT